MLKLSDIRQSYEDATKTLSDFNRQLCFAGFAIIWIFSGEKSEAIPNKLLWSGFLLCLSLFIDVLQYLITTFIWYNFYLAERRKNNNKGKEESQIEVAEPEKYNIAAWLFFILKVVFMMVAYILIGIFLISKL